MSFESKVFIFRVKGIVICIPTPLHDSMIELACKYKKHIFCEKPISMTLDGTIKCYALAKAANVALFCALNRRFDPALAKIQKQVASGRIGKLQLITSIGRDHPEPPENFFSAGSGMESKCFHSFFGMTALICRKHVRGHGYP